VTQEQVNLFADATGDHQWIHVDPERATAGPFGGTIAHGFLTVSLAPLLVQEVLEVADASITINYGLNKVRFPAPVPVGSRIRAEISCAAVDDVPVGRAPCRACWPVSALTPYGGLGAQGFGGALDTTRCLAVNLADGRSAARRNLSS
jgi:MaoC like domain